MNGLKTIGFDERCTAASLFVWSMQSTTWSLEDSIDYDYIYESSVGTITGAYVNTDELPFWGQIYTTIPSLDLGVY